MPISLSAVTRLFCILAALLPLTAAADPLGEREQQLHDHLQHLDRALRQAASLAELQAKSGKAPVADLRREAESFRRHLRSLEARVRGWDSAQREELLERFRALELVVRNLERAAALLERDPDAFAGRRAHQGPMAVGASTSTPAGKVGRSAKAAPANDACAAAQEIGFGTFVGDTVGATNDGDAYCGSSSFANDVWFKYSPQQTGEIFIDTFGSVFDTVLSVHYGCPGTYDNTANCNDNASGLQSLINHYAVGGEEVLIRVAGYAGAAGPFTLNVGTGGSISGTVTAAATGAPIAGVSVAVASRFGSVRASATTGADGTYTASGIHPDSYFVFILDSPGYAPEVYDGVPCARIRCSETQGGTLIEVGSNVDTPGIDFALDLGGTISGTVRESATGQPLHSTEVTVWDHGGDLVDYQYTDDSGRYAIEGLIAGAYFVSVRSQEHQDELHDGVPCSYDCDPTAGTAVETGAGITATVDFNLRRFGAISGTVTDAVTGDPIQFLDVIASPHGDDPGSGGYATTDHSGRYTLGGLGAGDYVARTDGYFFSDYRDEVFDDVPCKQSCDLPAGTPIAVELEATTAGIDFALDRFGRITGTLTDAGTGDPIGEPRVLVWDAEGDLRGSGEASSSGFYEAGGLSPGSYFLTTESLDPYGDFSGPLFLDELYDDLPCDEGCDPTLGVPVAVEVNQTAEGFDFDLVRRGEIAGTVTEESTGDPLRNVVISVWDETGAWVGSAMTTFLGSYEVLGLAPGTYFVRTAGDYYGDPFFFGNELYDDIPCEGPVPEACDVTLGTPVEVSLGDPVEGIDFALGPTAPEVVRISGRVTDAATGQPIRSVRVRAFDETGVRVRSDTTDAAGDFGIVGLPPGTYFVRTDSRFEEEYYDDPFAYRNELYDDLPCPGRFPDCDPTAGVAVIVGPDGTADGIDFALDPLGAITGRVTDAATGEPIVYDAQVSVWDATGSVVGSDYADGSGVYSVVGLSAGTYFVRASANVYPVDYSSEVYDGLPCSPSCDVTAGTPIAVDFGEVVAGIDFALLRPGSIAGTVTDAVTGSPIRTAQIEVWSQSGSRVGSGSSDTEGRYVVDNLSAGVYFVSVSEYFYFDTLYGGIRCPAEGCDPTVGAPVTVHVDAQTGGVDVALTRGGVISGQLTNALTGEDASFTSVDLWDAGGNPIGSVSSRSYGRFTFTALTAGTYFVTAGDGYSYYHQLYGGGPCPGGIPEDCDPTAGTPLVVTEGSFTSANFALLPVCFSSSTVLCLNDRRFRVEVRWEDFDGDFGSGRAFTLTDDSGYFWFFDPDNVEVVVKVLEACFPPFDHFWVFAGGLTNVRAELTVTDTLTGEMRTYLNPSGTAFLPIRDTAAFATCDAAGGAGVSSGPPPAEDAFRRFELEVDRLAKSHRSGPGAAEALETCGGAGLCLNQQRFRVEASWRTSEGVIGEGQPVQLTDDTGFLWFFDDDNVEVVVKVLDACGLAGFRNFWVFAAGLTDVEVVLKVTDTVSGEVREYFNPLGSAFQPVQDVSSFEVCP